MLPDEIALEPGQGATYYIGSGKVHKVEVMRTVIDSQQVTKSILDGYRNRFGTTLPVFDRTAYEYSGDTTALRAWRLERIMEARRVMAGL